MDINVSLYLGSAVLGFLGMVFAFLMQLKAQKQKAKSANVILKASQFFEEEWINMAISIIVIIIGLFLIPFVAGWKPAYLPFVKPAFLPIGYMGSDLMLKFFGVVNSKINGIIDIKSNDSDGTKASAAITPLNAK